MARYVRPTIEPYGPYAHRNNPIHFEITMFPSSEREKQEKGSRGPSACGSFSCMYEQGTTVGYRYLTRMPGVRGGQTIIEGTRVGVHDVIGLLHNGETVDTVVTRCFPNVTRAQVYECLAYYEDHRGEIDVLVARQMAASTVCDSDPPPLSRLGASRSPQVAGSGRRVRH
jgi:uncharacterized protein (DUF433 family)